MNLTILYEDNHLIAVYKPAGILVQGDASEDKSLFDYVKEYIKEKYKKPGNVFLGLLHRLDRNVSGIVLFAKTSKGASRLSEQFRNHTIEKIYHAWVIGKPKEESSILKNWLKKDERNNKALVYKQEVTNSQYAELSYTTIKTEEGSSLLKIDLETGRFHQIRAQLAYIGHPILGDVKYGAPQALDDQSLKLCATSLEFQIVTTTERKKIEIEIPSRH